MRGSIKNYQAVENRSDPLRVILSKEKNLRYFGRLRPFTAFRVTEKAFCHSLPGLSNNSGELSVDFIRDLWGFLKYRKKYWLLPIILTLLFFGALMVFAGGSAIAPFIYTIF